MGPTASQLPSQLPALLPSPHSPGCPAPCRPVWHPGLGCFSCPFRIQDLDLYLSIYQQDVCLEHTKCSKRFALDPGFPWSALAGSPEDNDLSRC